MITNCSWGCPVFYKDEFLLFGVHATLPVTLDDYLWDDVSRVSNTVYDKLVMFFDFVIINDLFKIMKLKSNCKFEYLPKLGYQFYKGLCGIVNEDVWLCFHDQA